jgi:transposase
MTFQPLTDAEWERLRPVLPPEHSGAIAPVHDRREIADLIVWKSVTGRSWRDVSTKTEIPWESVYYVYRTWGRHDTIKTLIAIIQERHNHAERNRADNTYLVA